MDNHTTLTNTTDLDLVGLWFYKTGYFKELINRNTVILVWKQVY
jgi:hypothetical protein